MLDARRSAQARAATLLARLDSARFTEFAQEPDHLAIRGLHEGLVVSADREEGLRLAWADQLVHLGAQRAAGGDGTDRYGSDHLARLVIAQRGDAGAQGGSGRETVVDDDHGAAAHAQRRDPLA